MSGLIHERSPEQVAVDALVLARVKRGIALLEERYGPTWVDHMKLSDLDLSSEERCVLGQIYGGFSYGIDNLGIDAEESYDFGFDINTLESPVIPYDAIQEIWERELRALGVPG